MPWYDALNRWSKPLDQRMDDLTLETGQKISVPFDVLVIFATNLDPLELVDEAYWRRMRNKIFVPDPTWDEFHEIFKREVARRKIAYSEEVFQYMIAEYYTQKIQRQPRGFHPRDILDILEDIAHFRDVPPVFSKESVDQACQVYFIKGGLESMLKEGKSVLI
jgi:SpoVK/Ycf46/Vps4 family AAA+-type ATPase